MRSRGYYVTRAVVRAVFWTVVVAGSLVAAQFVIVALWAIAGS